MKRLVVPLLLLAAAAQAITKAYEVVPYKNCIASAPGDPLHGVSQYIRMTLDSVSVVSFWVGDTVDSSRFHVAVRDSATNVKLAETRASGYRAPQSWAWLPCTLITTAGKRPVRGKTYKVTVTRDNGAEISFGYDPTGPYKYGNAVDGPALRA